MNYNLLSKCDFKKSTKKSTVWFSSLPWNDVKLAQLIYTVIYAWRHLMRCMKGLRDWQIRWMDMRPPNETDVHFNWFSDIFQASGESASLKKWFSNQYCLSRFHLVHQSEVLKHIKVSAHGVVLPSTPALQL